MEEGAREGGVEGSADTGADARLRGKRWDVWGLRCCFPRASPHVVDLLWSRVCRTKTQEEVHRVHKWGKGVGMGTWKGIGRDAEGWGRDGEGMVSGDGVPRYEKVQGVEVLTEAHWGGWWSWSRGTPAWGKSSTDAWPNAGAKKKTKRLSAISARARHGWHRAKRANE